MSRASDRLAARREARVRRAELRLFAAARAYARRLDCFSSSPLTEAISEASAEPELPSVIELLTEMEAAALNFANVVPAGSRRRQRGKRRDRR